MIELKFYAWSRNAINFKRRECMSYDTTTGLALVYFICRNQIVRYIVEINIDEIAFKK